MTLNQWLSSNAGVDYGAVADVAGDLLKLKGLSPLRSVADVGVDDFWDEWEDGDHRCSWFVDVTDDGIAITWCVV